MMPNDKGDSMGRPNRLGDMLSVHLSLPEKIYDDLQLAVRRRQQARPGASITLSEVVREMVMFALANELGSTH